MQRLLWKCVDFFLIVVNVASEESHIWWLRARRDLMHIEQLQGNPLEFLYQVFSVMGFSTQSPDHLLLLHLGLCFSVMSNFLDGILFDRSTRAPYIPVIDRQPMRPGPARVAGWWMCFPWAVLSPDLTHMAPRAASSAWLCPRCTSAQDTDLQPLVSDGLTELAPLFLAVDTCLCVCTAEGEHPQGLCRHCSSRDRDSTLTTAAIQFILQVVSSLLLIW